MTYKLKPKEAV